MSRLAGALVVALLTSRATLVAASTSGPDFATVLGYDPHTKLVYTEITHHDESGDLSTLVTLDLKRPGGQLPQKLEGGNVIGNREAWERADSLHTAHLMALKRHLIPLHCAEGRAIPDYEVLETDTVRAGGEKWPRYRLRMVASEAWSRGELDATVYKRPVLVFTPIAGIPGKHRPLVIVSYFPLAPYDCICESQFPVLLPELGDPPLVINGAPPR